MKKYLITLFLILSVNLSYSQNGWFLQNSGVSSDITDIFFTDVQNGWMVTDSSKVLRTTNGGDLWTLSTLPGDDKIPLSSIQFINQNTGFAGGGYFYFAHSGTLYKTTNAGINWFIFSHTGHIRDLCFSTEYQGNLAMNSSGDFESGGLIINTTNGGSNWQINSFRAEIISLSFINSTTGYSLGHYWDDTSNDSVVVYRTTDAGLSWDIKYNKYNYPFNQFGNYGQIFAHGDNVWISGLDSFIVYSSNSGSTWENQTLPDYKRKNGIFFIDENTGWAVGNNGYDTSNIIKTTNGGNTWLNLRNSNGNMLNNVFFVNQYTGWAAGSNGVILKTVTGGLTILKEQASIIPGNYILHQNFPNPFNPSTKISYALKSTGTVKLNVYDINGREVMTLVNEKLGAGNYEVNFSGADMASGIYIYKLSVNGLHVDSKKMLLMK